MAVVVAASGGTDQTAPSDNVRRPLDLQLLMAARSGDSEQLKELLRLEEEEEEAVAAAASEVVIVEVVPRRPPPPLPAAAAPPPQQAEAPSASASLHPPLDRAVTPEGDTLLHVVAACGDGEKFLHCAKMIVGRAATRRKALLEARNGEGDTPLHCAAGAGNAEMIFCLVDLACNAGDDGGAAAFLRMQNHRGETALHQAIRSASASSSKRLCVERLVTVDPGLARIEDVKGGSPLYLAISLGEVDIAGLLLQTSEGKLSYSGPSGRNVLHAAVSCSQSQVLLLVLEWLMKEKVADMRQEGQGDLLSKLTSQQEEENGSTPLHLAASLLELSSSPVLSLFLPTRSWKVRWWSGRSTRIKLKLLLQANKSMVYQPDNEGLYPIHVAASAGSFTAVKVLLECRPDCATVGDAKQGRTFLHFAVEKQRHYVVQYVCRTPELSSILNVQDKNGDTALHRAVHAGGLATFRRLIVNTHVRLDVPNKETMTPIDVSWSTMPIKAYYAWDPRIHIRKSLLTLAAPYGQSRGDLIHEKHNIANPKFKGGEDKISEDLTASAQVMGIFSVLIATVTFASAFTLPGGYRSAGDGGVAGTPLLAGSYAFDAFVLSNTLAFICSLFATSLLLYVGVPAGSLQYRFHWMNAAYNFMMNSGRSLVAAFALGMYLVLLPVSRTIPIVIIVWMVILGFGGLLKASEANNSLLNLPIIARRGKTSQVVLYWIVCGMQYFWSLY